MLVMFYHCLEIHMTRHRAITENVTLSTKPEVYNLLTQRRQNRIKPGLYATRITILVKLGRVILI